MPLAPADVEEIKTLVYEVVEKYSANAFSVESKIETERKFDLLERIVRVEEELKYLREDIKQLHEDTKELRQDMDKRFSEVRQDMNGRFIEQMQNMNRIHRTTMWVISIWGTILAGVVSLATLLR